ncbi:hypothetical protein NHF46_10055 [Arthrobacter alpinus]|nr:hypothetical protein [Arthrobacter alpinus]
MLRARLPLCTWGQITRKQLKPKFWRARAKFRSFDGVIRRYEAWGPTGPKAEAALIHKLTPLNPVNVDEIGPEMQLRELSRIWWAEFEDFGRAANTSKRYRELLDAHILPGTGELTIREVNVNSLDRFLKTIRTNSGAATATMCKTILSGMLSLATRHGAISADPLREVAKIPIVTKEVRALTLEEVIALRKGVYAWQQPTGRPNGLHEKDILDVVDIMLATGARIGEALAIHWSEVDLEAEKPTETVNGTVIKVKGTSGLQIQDIRRVPILGNATFCRPLRLRCSAGARPTRPEPTTLALSLHRVSGRFVIQTDSGNNGARYERRSATTGLPPHVPQVRRYHPR